MVTQSSENLDGQELKSRIIRRADELRQQWKESTGMRIPAINAKQSASPAKIAYKTSDVTPKSQFVLPAVNSKDSFNPVLFFQTKGIKVIDNREQNGGIWVEGGNELSSIMQTLAAKGIQFRFVPGGIPYISAAGRHYYDGWYAKSI